MVRRHELSRNCNRLVRDALTQVIYIKNYWKVIVLYNVFLGQDNAGFTYTEQSKRISIVGIGKTSSKEQLINTIAHEAKHVQSHICSYYNIKEDGENAAYLLGYIVERMYKIFKHLI